MVLKGRMKTQLEDQHKRSPFLIEAARLVHLMTDMQLPSTVMRIMSAPLEEYIYPHKCGRGILLSYQDFLYWFTFLWWNKILYRFLKSYSWICNMFVFKCRGRKQQLLIGRKSNNHRPYANPNQSQTDSFFFQVRSIDL